MKLPNIRQTALTMIMWLERVDLGRSGKFIARELMEYLHLKRCQKPLSYQKRAFQA